MSPSYSIYYSRDHPISAFADLLWDITSFISLRNLAGADFVFYFFTFFPHLGRYIHHNFTKTNNFTSYRPDRLADAAFSEGAVGVIEQFVCLGFLISSNN